MRSCGTQGCLPRVQFVQQLRLCCFSGWVVTKLGAQSGGAPQAKRQSHGASLYRSRLGKVVIATGQKDGVTGPPSPAKSPEGNHRLLGDYLPGKKSWSLLRSTVLLLRRNLWGVIFIFALKDALAFLLHRASHRLTNTAAESLLQVHLPLNQNPWWLCLDPSFLEQSVPYQGTVAIFFVMCLPFNILLNSIAFTWAALLCTSENGESDAAAAGAATRTGLSRSLPLAGDTTGAVAAPGAAGHRSMGGDQECAPQAFNSNSRAADAPEGAQTRDAPRSEILNLDNKGEHAERNTSILKGIDDHKSDVMAVAEPRSGNGATPSWTQCRTSSADDSSEAAVSRHAGEARGSKLFVWTRLGRAFVNPLPSFRNLFGSRAATAGKRSKVEVDEQASVAPPGDMFLPMRRGWRHARHVLTHVWPMVAGVWVTDLTFNLHSLPLQALSLLVVPVFYTLPRLLGIQLTLPVAVLEGHRGQSALKRSRHLMQGLLSAYFWPFVSLLAALRIMHLVRGMVLLSIPARWWRDVIEVPLFLEILFLGLRLVLARCQDLLPLATFNVAIEAKAARADT